MRAAVTGQAELFAISYTLRVDLTYKSDQEMEKASMQYVSGRIFDSFGLRPALGRLLNEGDDLTQGAHPYAVITYDYWARRFGLDPGVIGRGFRVGDDSFQIVGVVDRPFTGTEPGTVIDIFVPAMMSPKVIRADQTWIRTLARLRPGVAVEPLRAKLNATSRAFEEERAKGFSGMTETGAATASSNQTLVIGARGRGSFRIAKRLPAFAPGDRRSRGAGAVDRVRQRRQPHDGSGSRPRTGDGVACLDRRRAMAPGAVGAGGERDTRWRVGRARRVVRLVVCAVCRQPDRFRAATRCVSRFRPIGACRDSAWRSRSP